MQPQCDLESAESRLAVSDRVRHSGANSMLMAWIAKRPGMTRWKWNWGRNEHHENSNRQSRGNCLPRNPYRAENGYCDSRSVFGCGRARAAPGNGGRSEERSVGKEWVSTFRVRWAPSP